LIAVAVAAVVRTAEAERVADAVLVRTELVNVAAPNFTTVPFDADDVTVPGPASVTHVEPL
jgi:hypothetical protein